MSAVSVPEVRDELEIVSGVRDALCVLADLLELQGREEQCGMVVALAEDLRRAMDIINAGRDREYRAGGNTRGGTGTGRPARGGAGRGAAAVAGEGARGIETQGNLSEGRKR